MEWDVINKRDLIEIRDSVEDDRPFIFQTWLRGLRHGNEFFSLIDSDSYFKAYHQFLEFILNDFEVEIKVACLKEDPSVILAYAVFKNTRLDWVFCKRDWRGIGLARDLVPTNITTITHLTKIGLSLLRKHKGVTFDPFSPLSRKDTK